MLKKEQENIMESKQSWVAEVQEDPESPGDLILTFPEDLLAAAGWTVGDTIKWNQEPNGAWILEKLSNNSVEG